MKDDGLLRFKDKSREELIDTILKQEEEIEKLKRRIKEKEEADARRRDLKLARLLARKKRQSKPGQKAGHRGLTRPQPNNIDRVIEQKLKLCPECHHSLSESQETITHIQEDIVPAHAEVTMYKKHRYYCKHCKKVVTAPYAPDEVPSGYLGPNALIHMAILKYHHALPGNKIVEIFKDIFNMKVSEGAVTQALKRLSEWLKVEMGTILEAIRKSPNIHIDETGWKVNGKRHWLWAFVNKTLAYYKIDRSRGSKVPKKILPSDYGGIIITDFYSAYNRLPGKKQKCLVHLLSEMRSSYEKSDAKEFLKYHRKLKRILTDAIRLGEIKDDIPKETLYGRILKIKRRLLQWSIGNYKDKHLSNLATRFLKHWFDLTTFLEEEGVSFNNNIAERMIRPNVIIRNRSYQNRSQTGAQAHEVLMSILQTLRLQQKEAIPFLKRAYLTHRQGNPTPLLTF